MRKVRIEAPRGDIVDRNDRKLVDARRSRRSCRSRPSRCPKRCARTPTPTARRALDGRERAARRRTTSSRRSSAPCARRRPQARKRRASAERRALRKAARRSPRRCRSAAARLARPSLIALYQRIGRVLGDLAARRSTSASIRGHRRRAVLQRHDPHRRRRARVQLPARAREDVPGRRRREALPARATRTRRSPRSCSARVSRSRPQQLKEKRYKGVAPGHADRPERAREALRQVPARHRRLHARRRRRDSAAATTSAVATRTRAQAGRAAAAHARPRPAAGAATTRWRRRSPRVAATAPRPAPSWRWTRATARSSRWAPSPSFDANVFAKPFSQSTYDRLTSQANGAPLLNRAIAAAYPTGSTFKPITAMAALDERPDRRRARRSSTTATYKLGTAEVPERQGRELRRRSTCPTR